MGWSALATLTLPTSVGREVLWRRAHRSGSRCSYSEQISAAYGAIDGAAFPVVGASSVAGAVGAPDASGTMLTASSVVIGGTQGGIAITTAAKVLYRAFVRITITFIYLEGPYRRRPNK